MESKQPKLIYPCGFEVLDLNRKKEQEKGIDKAIENGYMPVFVFNDNATNTENFIPIKFEKGIEKHNAYFTWVDMLLQKYDSGHPKYKKYNIKIEKTWVSSFTQFLKDLGFPLVIT